MDEVEGHIVVTFKVNYDDETEQYLARCEELSISSFAPTIEEALAAIEDATLLYLDTLEDERERDRVFAELGLAILPGHPDEQSVIAVPARPREFISYLR